MRFYMKKLILSLVVAFLLCFTVAANTQAEEAKDSSKIGLYIEPKLGVTAFTGEYLQRNGHSGSAMDSAVGIGGGLAVGYDFWEKLTIPFRFEAEYMVRSTPHMKADSKSFRAIAPQTMFANLYFDFHNETDFTPYVGGGVGAAFVGPELFIQTVQITNEGLLHDRNISQVCHGQCIAGLGNAAEQLQRLVIGRTHHRAELQGIQTRLLRQFGKRRRVEHAAGGFLFLRGQQIIGVRFQRLSHLHGLHKAGVKSNQIIFAPCFLQG